MTIDHIGKIVLPDFFEVTHAIGRVAFPLFAGLIGIRLASRPELAAQYLRRLVPWAIVAQPVFVLAGREWHEGNILVTLALGVLVWQARTADDEPGRLWRLGLALPLSTTTDFGPAGVLMPAAVAEIVERGGVRSALYAIGPLGVVANVVFAVPPLVPIDLFAVLATPIALASASLSRELPRVPSSFFYAYYPGHLFALHWIDVWWSG